MTICCRYDVVQSNIKYSGVKQSMSRDDTKTVPTNVKSFEPDYDVVNADLQLSNSDVKMNPNPAYYCDIKMHPNPAYKA